MLLIGRVGEKFFGHLAPMRGGRERKFVFGLEVVEEAPLGYAGSMADVVNRRRRIALGAYRV
jgi:hypothetical protein